MYLTSLTETELVRLAPFNELKASEAAEILAIISVQKYRAGEQVFKAGAPGDAMYAIVSGEVDIVLPAPGKGERTVATLPPQSILGEVSLLTQRPRSAGAVARTDVALVRLANRDFWDLIERDRLAAYKVLKHVSILLAQRLREVDVQLARAAPAVQPVITSELEEIEDLRLKLFTEWSF